MPPPPPPGEGRIRGHLRYAEFLARLRSRATVPDEPRACVFWDLFDFSLYERKPCEIYQITKRSLEKTLVSSGALSIKAYAHEDIVTDELVRDYKEAGITILPVPDDEHARVEYMISDIFLWTMENPSNSCPYSLTVCVVSKLVTRESLFRNILQKVERLGYKVCVPLPHDHLSSNVLDFVSILDGDKPNDEGTSEALQVKADDDDGYHLTLIW